MTYDPSQLPPTRQIYPQQYAAGQASVSAQPDLAHGYPPHQPPPDAWQQVPQQLAYPQSAPPAGYWQQVVPPKRTWGSGTVVIVCVTVVSVVVGCVALLGPNRQEPQAKTTAKATDVPTAAATPSRKPGKPAPLSPPDKVENVEMPDVKGQNAAVAEDYMGKLGFTNIEFGTQDPAEGFVVLPENWTVKKQSTKAGRKVPTDTLIVLTCTKIG